MESTEWTVSEGNGTDHDPRVISDKFNSYDVAVVVGYFILVLATGFYSMCVSNRSTISGYFLAGRFVFWLPVGASLFASNIGSEHFIGLAGSGAASGISVGAFELNALAIIQLTGWVFLPVFIASRVCTLPEYMSKRFGGLRIRTYLAVLSLVLYVFTKISVNEVACVDPDICLQYCQNPAGCSNVAYPRLVLELMPTGLRGLMMAVMLTALMSDLTSVYNSASTLFTMDIWPQIRKKATVWELMIVGRTFVIIMILLSIAWIPIIQNLQGGQLFIYIQSVSAYLSPPIAAVYILAVLWKRMNETGCFWGMMLGFVVGVTRMILDFVYRQPGCNEMDTRPVIIQKVHYMYFACILFCISVISSVVISLMTDPPGENLLLRTTYWTRFDQGYRKDDKENFEMRRNVDLQEKVRLNDFSKEEAGDVNDEHTPHLLEERTWLFYLKNLGNWFCGFSQDTQHKNEEVYAHLTEIASLRQSNRDKIILNSLLVVALTIPLVTYLYFSVAAKNLGF